MSNIDLLAEIRARMKARKITYSQIGHLSGNSNSWIGVVLRGGYPYRGAGKLPKNIRVALEHYGLEVHQNLITY